MKNMYTVGVLVHGVHHTYYLFPNTWKDPVHVYTSIHNSVTPLMKNVYTVGGVHHTLPVSQHCVELVGLDESGKGERGVGNV